VPGLIIGEFFNALTQPSDVSSPWVWIAILLATGLAQIIAIVLGGITKTQHRFTMNSLIQRNLLAKVLERPGAKAMMMAEDKTISPGGTISFFREDAGQIEVG
jgi:ATP-binding cassette, subfamily B, bacterial